MSSGVCGTENLLANRLPPPARTSAATCGSRPTARSRRKGRSGTRRWACFFDTAGRLADLGPRRRSARVSSFLLQADANDSYKIFGADDGHPVGVQAAGRGRERRQRRPRAADAPGAPSTPSRCASCASASRWATAPTRCPSSRPTAARPTRSRPSCRSSTRPRPRWCRRRGGSSTGSTNDASARFEMGLALLRRWPCSAGGSGWTSRGGRSSPQALRDGLLLFLGVVSFACYFNFGLWHFRNYVHQWDTFHYYAGSKYFKEMSYDRLYECIAVADSEEPGLRRRVELRKVMNLRTNMMEGTERDPRPPGGVQEPLHAGALAVVQEGRRPLPRQARRQALGGAADRPRLQRHAGLEHRGHDAGEHRAGQRRSGRLPHQDRSVLHRRHHADDAGGRSAGGRCASRWWCWRPTSRHASTGRGRLPALGLAVLLRRRHLPGEEGSAVPGRHSSWATRRCCGSSRC